MYTRAFVSLLGGPPARRRRPDHLVGAEPRRSGVGRHPADLQFEKYTLPNGLEVILSQKRGLPMVAVNLWYHVGPANEDKGEPASRISSST